MGKKDNLNVENFVDTLEKGIASTLYQLMRDT